MTELIDKDIITQLQESKLLILNQNIEKEKLLHRLEQKEKYISKLNDTINKYDAQLSKTYNEYNAQLEDERLENDIKCQSQQSKVYSIRAKYHELQFLYGVEVYKSFNK